MHKELTWKHYAIGFGVSAMAIYVGTFAFILTVTIADSQPLWIGAALLVMGLFGTVVAFLGVILLGITLACLFNL